MIIYGNLQFPVSGSGKLINAYLEVLTDDPVGDPPGRIYYNSQDDLFKVVGLGGTPVVVSIIAGAGLQLSVEGVMSIGSGAVSALMMSSGALQASLEYGREPGHVQVSSIAVASGNMITANIKANIEAVVTTNALSTSFNTLGYYCKTLALPVRTHNTQGAIHDTVTHSSVYGLLTNKKYGSGKTNLTTVTIIYINSNAVNISDLEWDNTQGSFGAFRWHNGSWVNLPNGSNGQKLTLIGSVGNDDFIVIDSGTYSSLPVSAVTDTITFDTAERFLGFFYDYGGIRFPYFFPLVAGIDFLFVEVFNKYNKTPASYLVDISFYNTSLNTSTSNAIKIDVGVPAVEWDLLHNLGTEDIAVQCYGTDKKLIYPDNVEVIDSNNVKITFSVNQTGKVIIFGV